MSISITGPLFLIIPVLSLSERVFERSLHLLQTPIGRAFDGQAAAIFPDAAPMRVQASFPDFCCFAAR